MKLHSIKSGRGVTIVELMVVLTIIGLMMGISVISLTGNDDVRNDAMRLASIMKYTYSNACINNTRYRMVFEVGTGNYHTEVTDEPVIALDDGVEDADLLTEEAQELAQKRDREEDLFDEEEENPFGINRKVSFQRVEDVVVKDTSLSEGVRFDKIYSPRFPDGPIKDGLASMSFFPNGMQEQILVVIKDEDGVAYSILTEPLTGRVKLFSKEIEIPEGFGEVESDD